MSLKTKFYEDESYGLTHEEMKIGQKYLRKHKTIGAIPQIEALKLQELFMIGTSFRELQEQYPQYPMGQIILTAALRKWMKDRDKLTFTLQDRIKARIIKSLIGQVDFLTTLLEVSNIEHLQKMREYILDPANKTPPTFKASSFKEYKEVAELLYKLATGSGKGNTPLFDDLKPSGEKKSLHQLPQETSPANLLEAECINVQEK